MKNLLSALSFAIVLIYSSIVLAQAITIDTYNKKEPAQGEFDSRGPVKSFEVTGGADPVVYFKYELGGNGAWETHPLILLVTKDDGTVAFNYPFDPGGASGISYANSSIPEGNYTAKIVDGSDESYVWCKKDFTVAAAMNKVAGSNKVIFCDYVDDNWNPINPVTVINAGQCVNFMVELPQTEDRIQIVGWEVYKVKKNGSDGDFVGEFMMSLPNSDNINHFATTEKLCMFKEKGKYRVYAINWYDKSANYNQGNFEKYYAKSDVTVE